MAEWQIRTPSGFLVPGMASSNPELLKARYAKVMGEAWDSLFLRGYRLLAPRAALSSKTETAE